MQLGLFTEMKRKKDNVSENHKLQRVFWSNRIPDEREKYRKTLLNRGFNHIYREISNKGQGSIPTTKPVQIFNPLPNEVYLETFTLHLNGSCPADTRLHMQQSLSKGHRLFGANHDRTIIIAMRLITLDDIMKTQTG